MGNCEICEQETHPDELRECPNKNCIYTELCERCYDEHVTSCTLSRQFE